MPVDADAVHEEFTIWSLARGVQVNGVQAIVLPGRGAGLVATEHIKQGQKILFVPNNAMFKPDAKQSRPEDPAFAQNASPQAQLTLSLIKALRTPDADLEIWEATWPSREDLRACMPLQWDSALQKLLPQAAEHHLNLQMEEYKRDLESLPATWRDRIAEADFLYYWCIVNSRAFHFKPPGSRPGYEVMCPFMDYLNHGPSGTGVEVKQTSRGYEAVADRDYAPGTEILATYGAHSNDKLLVHYGFMLCDPPPATDDFVALDSILMPTFSPSVRDKLQQAGFLGSYALVPSTGDVCFKTQVAVRAMFLESREWDIFRTRGDDAGGRDHGARVREVLRPLVQGLRDQARKHLEEITAERTASAGGALQAADQAWDLLTIRWTQVSNAVEGYLGTHENGTGTHE